MQRKLAIGTSSDPLEQEADRVAEEMSASPRPAAGGPARHIRHVTGHPGATAETTPASVDRVLASPGRPLEQELRREMAERFSYDFSRVRLHSGRAAEQSARELNAHAYTVGTHIVFGAGRFSRQTSQGRRLLAHELTHVVQQRSLPAEASTVQKQGDFVGAAGTTALDRDRPLVAVAGPMPETRSPGGTIVPNTAGTGENCAGDSCNIRRWINWPYLGFEVPNVRLQGNGVGDWGRAINFVPSGCTRVNCSGIDVNNTRCRATELELLALLYRWPATRNVGGTPMAGSQSDFHVMGRDASSLPSGWHSKMDRRERVVDIRDPMQSLHDAYPHTLLPDRIAQRLCFCCTQSAITTT